MVCSPDVGAPMTKRFTRYAVQAKSGPVALKPKLVFTHGMAKLILEPDPPVSTINFAKETTQI